MDEGKVSKARMQLVRSRCQRIRAPKLERRHHATSRWQDGGVVLLSHRSRTSLSAFSPRKVDGTRAKDPRCAPAGFSQGPAYKSRPGLLTRLGQIGVLGSVVGFRMTLGTTCTLGPSPRRNSRQVTPHQADRRLDTVQLLSKQIADSTPPFLPCLPGTCSLERLRGYVIGPSLESSATLHQSAADTTRRPIHS